ncbi:MAG: UvrD-helicase domain-containing protein [Bacilli bacterium]|nr:UvrD-helicase domain-containing protein [Bacilli bacterium]
MPKWTEEQLQAIEKNGTNIIVSAGAGSGKTAVLTERVIHKLKSGIKINELLILTFTNAAAGEMKDRIRKKISEHDDLKDNLDYLDSSYITTFDSFTLSLVKKYHYILNVSPTLSIVDSGIINLLKEEALDRVFEEFYEQNDEQFLKLINDFCVKNDKALKASVKKIISSLELKSDIDKYLDNYVANYFISSKIEEYFQEYLDLIKDEIKDIETALYLISDSEYYDYYEQMSKALEPLIKARDYDEVKKAILVTLPRRPRGSDDVKEYKDQIDLALKNLKEYTRFENETEIYETFNTSQTYIEAIIRIIKKHNQLIKEYKKTNDLYEFTDIELMAISLLKNNPDICDELKNFYKEIMVDEYQDTNDLQEEFISLIQNDNVYMVGDIKQSIYGFRNANPSIFKNKYDKYSNLDGGIKIDLLKNFRSRDEVLNGINHIFNLIMDDTLGGASYKESHQMVFGNTSYEENKNHNQNYDLEVYNYSHEDNTYTKEEIEAFIIGNDIKNKINSGYEVIDKASGKLRASRYDDFCIIMDRGSAFPTYKKIFEYLQIPLIIYEDKRLTNETDIMLINNIINMILKIKDRIFDQEFRYSFVSIARSYLFEYSDNDILKTIKDKAYFKTDIYAICEKISGKLEVINNYELLNLIIDEFKFYERAIKVGNVDDTIVRIDNLLSIASNLASIGYTPYMFKEYITQMINSDNEISYKVITSASLSVKIMNIHKSKGLEFPVCYFSGYHKAFNTSDIKERFVYDNKYGIITPFFKEGIGSMILKDLLKNKYTIDNISERIRLFYVAVTRAKEKMIIVSSLDDESQMKASGVVDYSIRRKYNSFLSILNSIKGNLKDYTKNIDLKELDLTKDYLFSNKLEDNLNKTSETISYSSIEILNEELNEKHASKTINEIISKETGETLKYGTMMHEVFENADFLNISQDNPHYEKLVNFTKRLNITENTKLYKEHEFIYEKDNIQYHGIIDLVLVEEEVIKIVDYKLKNIEDEKYKDQLKVYYDYLYLLTNKPIKTYLYSIIEDNLKEIKLEN